MACLKVISARGMRIIPESVDGNVRGMLPDEKIVGVDMLCAPVAIDNFTDIFTSEGVMVGNLIKRATNALGIKQCLSCKGRQQRYNTRGLAIQKRVKNAILRS